MIEVVTFNTDGRTRRDCAEAESPAAAVVAAKTLLRDAREAGHYRVTASFYVDGRLVRSDVSAAALSHWAAL